MPKYYVSAPNLNTVIMADNAIDACVKVATKHNVVTVGLLWKVSERGFGGHPEDEVIDDHEIVKEINRRKRKK
jgi:hypothetical protein